MSPEQSRLPASMVVGPYRYSIELDEQAAFESDFFGRHNARTRRIQLDPRQAATEMPQTVVHEMLHALGAVYDIKDWDRHKTDDAGRHIDKIDLMATALLGWLRANPEMVRWLQEDP